MKKLVVQFQYHAFDEEGEEWLAWINVPGMVVTGKTKADAWKELMKSLEVLCAYNSGISANELSEFHKEISAPQATSSTGAEKK